MTRASRLLMHLAAIGVLLCLACGLHADTAKGVSLGLKVFTVSGQVADGVSTVMSDRELNPAMKPIAGKPAVLLATKAAVGVGAVALGDLLAKKGHPRAGRVLCILGGVAGWGAAGWNLAQGGGR